MYPLPLTLMSKTLVSQYFAFPFCAVFCKSVIACPCDASVFPCWVTVVASCCNALASALVAI